MKVKFKYHVPRFDYNKETIINVDENELINMKGWEVANYINNKLERWIDEVRMHEQSDYEVLDGKYAGCDIPYLENPFSDK